MRPPVDPAGDQPAAGAGRRSSAALFRRALLFCFSLFLLAAVLAHPAGAQTPSPLANWQYSAGEVLAKLDDEPLPEWRVTLGASGSVAPKYEGADTYHVTPGGIIDIRYRDIAFFSVGEGLGVNLLRGDTYRAGVAVSYDLGRNDNDDFRIRGLGDVDPAPEAKLFAQVFILPVVLTADLRRGIGGHDGWIGDFGMYIPYADSSESFIIFAGPSITLADQDYMDSYFSVSPGQASNSRLPAFQADAGFKNANFGVTALYFIDDNWLIVADAAVEQLLGDAARSPVTQSHTQFTFDISIAYMF
jgi:outer membrane scaffolding protein for murein synthesis (MipA/OmpV family)